MLQVTLQYRLAAIFCSISTLPWFSISCAKLYNKAIRSTGY